jgi:hypothetical protein
VAVSAILERRHDTRELRPQPANAIRSKYEIRAREGCFQNKIQNRRINLRTARLDHVEHPCERICALASVKELLVDLDLGNSVAEFDSQLETYFVETQPFRELILDRKDIIAGDKGTGKPGASSV